MKRALLWLLVLAQTVLATKVITRLFGTMHGDRLRAPNHPPADNEGMTVLVPVLNEFDRLAPCLEGLIKTTAPVREIIIVDGGSTDWTLTLSRTFADRDPRVTIVAAGPAPCGVNGKAWQLGIGLEAADPDNRWIATIDADVRPGPHVFSALLGKAIDKNASLVSVATRQVLSGPAEALLHPSLLTTLVYRFGIPGTTTTDRERVQANGQCMVLRRDALEDVGGFSAFQHHIAEDVAIANALASSGHPVGFYETDDLVRVEMYRSAPDAWRNWTRSLPLINPQHPAQGWIGIASVLLVQSAPLIVVGLLRDKTWTDRAVRRANLGLVFMRLGILIGTRRAYERPPATYWLSPLLDSPMALSLVVQGVRRRHHWRGRMVIQA